MSRRPGAGINGVALEIGKPSTVPKPEVVKRFLRGQSIQDVAVYFGLRESSVETILREAIAGLGELNRELGTLVKAHEEAVTATEAARPAAPTTEED